MVEDMQGHGFLECQDTQPGPAKPFFKVTEGIERTWLFGAIRYTSVGSISMVDLCGWRAYERLGGIKCVAGFVFGRDKAGE